MEQRTAVLGGSSLYAWTVVPPLWLTTRRRDCRIFQQKSAPDIVEAVLADPTYAGRIAPPVKLLGNHPRHEYAVQYDETDWEFISRILADAGIASFFDHANGSAWTLVDDTPEMAPDLTRGPIPFTDRSRMSLGGHGLEHAARPDRDPRARASRRPRSRSATTISRSRTFVLQATQGIDGGVGVREREPGLEAYCFEVGKFTVQAPGDARALAWLEASRAARRRVLCRDELLPCRRGRACRWSTTRATTSTPPSSWCARARSSTRTSSARTSSS